MLIIVVGVAKVLKYVDVNRVIYQVGDSSDDIAMIQSYLDIEKVTGKYDEKTKEAVLVWQNKFNVENKEHKKLKTDGKLRKITINSMNFNIDENNYIIKDENYKKYFELAFTKEYDGFLDVEKYFLKKLKNLEYSNNGPKISILGIELEILNSKTIENKVYAKEEDIINTIYKDAENQAKSKLLRIFPEEENYEKYILFSDSMKIKSYRIENIDKVLLIRIAAFLRDNNRKIQILEGFRSSEDQIYLYNKNPISAILPGKSWHEYGVAIDIDYRVIYDCIWLKKMYEYSNTQEQVEFLKYGFYKPYTKANKEELLQNSISEDNNIIYENWHIQPIETKYDEDQKSYLETTKK
jgi:hypothetical protein